jgi:hypothetical protein
MSRRVTYYNSSYASFQYDVDALEFITNWELSTSAIMPLTQRLAVNDLYRGLKGEGTPNGTDFFTTAQNYGAMLYPLIPLDDSSANADAYKLDAISKGVHQGDYVNFAGGDFTQMGVIGGNTKYFDPFASIVDYVTDNEESAQGFYNRSDIIQTTVDCGEDGANYMFTQLSNNVIRWRLGATTDVNNTYTGSTKGVGLTGISTRLNQKRAFNNTNFLGNNNYTWSSTLGGGVLFHAYRKSSPTSFSTRQLSCYFIGFPYFNQNQLTDFYTIIQRLQSNVIAGGRQIGTPIAPI